MAGRKPGALVKIAELTGITKSLVKHCVASLQARDAITTPILADRETWKPQLMDTAAIIAVAQLTKSGFATTHAADMVAAMLNASAHFSDVYPKLEARPFWSKFNDGLAQWFGPEAASIYRRGEGALFRDMTFREFLWSALATYEEFIEHGYRDASPEAEQDAERAQRVWNRSGIGGGQPVRAAPPMPACVVRYNERFANLPEDSRCSVLVERPGYDWVLFGVGAGGNKLDQLIRNAAPFESVTTFQPRMLLSQAFSIYVGDNPDIPANA